MLGTILVIAAVVMILAAMAYGVRVSIRRRVFDTADPNAANASLDAQARTLANGQTGRPVHGAEGYLTGH